MKAIQEDILADRYKVTELLGEGGIGVVYKASDLQSGKDVAIKFLIVEQTGDPNALASAPLSQLDSWKNSSHADVDRSSRAEVPACWCPTWRWAT